MTFSDGHFLQFRSEISDLVQFRSAYLMVKSDEANQARTQLNWVCNLHGHTISKKLREEVGSGQPTFMLSEQPPEVGLERRCLP